MRIITPPEKEPITLSDVRRQLGILTTEVFDEILAQRRIIEAREWAEEYMECALITQTQEIRLDQFPHSADSSIELAQNLQSVTSVKYIDDVGVLTTIDSALYEVDTYNFIGSVVPVIDEDWPYSIGRRNSVRIQYVCGYGDSGDDVPKILKEGLCLLVGHLMNKQTANENGVVYSRIPYSIRDIFDTKRILKVG
jgi:uncharacterized phiE125 gp8 family phage protein